MTFKVIFIWNKKLLENENEIDASVLSESERIKVIWKEHLWFVSVVSAKHNGQEVVIKETLCNLWAKMGKLSLVPFSAAISDSVKNLNRFLSFTDNFMLGSFETSINKISFGIAGL